MANVTIPKTEYEQLKRQAFAYRRFAAKLFESVVRDPIDEVIEDFRKTNLYTERFLSDLQEGLRQSTYVKTYATKTAEKRS